MPEAQTGSLPVLLLNGPNLNLLGEREQTIYGKQTFEAIEDELKQLARASGLELLSVQSNHEGVLIDQIQAARNTTSGLIINPGGLTHTSVSLRDALLLYSKPKFEVHLSNIYTRESFRHHSLMSGAVDGVLCGFGVEGYKMALNALLKIF
ncbi:MAG: type II 3-dehydroquinate dehydratase [Cyanobacteria bacterium]|nr:type II 3-dehydroquinate dehydratase [Cyanobacteriota bacterium]